MRFDDSYREEIRLRNGDVVLLRPIRPDDKELLLGAFARLSGRSRYSRFLSPRKGFTDGELEFLTEVDGISHFAIGAARILERRVRGRGCRRTVHPLAGRPVDRRTRDHGDR